MELFPCSVYECNGPEDSLHFQEDELNTVKSEGGSQISESPTKKRAYVRRKSGEKEAIKRWEDGKLSSLRTEPSSSAVRIHHRSALHYS